MHLMMAKHVTPPHAMQAASSSSVIGGLTGAFASLFGMPRTLDQVKKQQQQQQDGEGGGGGGCPVDHGKGGAAAGPGAGAAAPLNPLNNERLYSQVRFLCVDVDRSIDRSVSE